MRGLWLRLSRSNVPDRRILRTGLLVLFRGLA